MPAAACVLMTCKGQKAKDWRVNIRIAALQDWRQGAMCRHDVLLSDPERRIVAIAGS
jgi:hypothetical protein